jgi:hypothetical protein
MLSLAVGAIAIGLATLSQAARATEIDPEAAALVRSMTDHLQALTAFSVQVETGTDVVLKSGQKHKLTSSALVLVRRPGELHVVRKGELADGEVVYDGKTVSILARGANSYFQAEVAGTIDALLDTLRSDYGIEFPAADLFSAQAYDQLMTGAWSVDYYGESWIDGAACHHIAVRTESVDWQVWIQADGEPLPCQYVITSKWVAGAPEHAVRFRSWNEKPEISADSFAFAPPEGATKLEVAPADEIGLLSNGE